MSGCGEDPQGAMGAMNLQSPAEVRMRPGLRRGGARAWGNRGLLDLLEHSAPDHALPPYDGQRTGRFRSSYRASGPPHQRALLPSG
jgi:hypothetical protein